MIFPLTFSLPAKNAFRGKGKEKLEDVCNWINASVDLGDSVTFWGFIFPCTTSMKTSSATVKVTSALPLYSPLWRSPPPDFRSIAERNRFSFSCQKLCVRNCKKAWGLVCHEVWHTPLSDCFSIFSDFPAKDSVNLLHQLSADISDPASDLSKHQIALKLIRLHERKHSLVKHPCVLCMHDNRMVLMWSCLRRAAADARVCDGV